MIPRLMNNRGMLRSMRARLCLVALAAWLAATAPAGATPPIQRKARDAGFLAEDCIYCHNFNMAHMRERARALGISNMNCYTCHGGKLPLTGANLYNDRGKFLLAEKGRRKVKEVDVSWLKDYVEKDEKKAKK